MTNVRPGEIEVTERSQAHQVRNVPFAQSSVAATIAPERFDDVASGIVELAQRGAATELLQELDTHTSVIQDELLQAIEAAEAPRLCWQRARIVVRDVWMTQSGQTAQVRDSSLTTMQPHKLSRCRPLQAERRQGGIV